MKEKILWAGIIVALISWVGNYTYFQSKQLDQPIFLDHYYDMMIGEETNLTFYYLANKQERTTVSSVVLDGVQARPLHAGGFMYSDNRPQYEQEFRHHYLKSVTVRISKDELSAVLPESGELAVGTIEVMFSDGHTMTADIGQVRLNPAPIGPFVLESRISSSSNRHRDINSFVASESVIIEGILIPFSDQLEDDIAIKLDVAQDKLHSLEELKTGADPPAWYDERMDDKWEELPGVDLNEALFPITLEKGEWLQLLMQFNPERTSYFQFDIGIQGTTADGEPFIGRSPIIDHPYLEQGDVDDIIETKQGGTSK